MARVGGHRWKIGLAVAAGLAACGGPRFAPGNGPDPVATVRALPPQPLDEVLVAEVAGVSPTDTTVRFAAAEGRTVLLRHSPPDNAIFAIVAVPPDSGASDSVTVTLRSSPGRYGLVIGAEPRLPGGGTITFSYAIHFQAPSTLAGSRYRDARDYARWLGIGRVVDGDRLQFLAFSHPAGDQLRAPLDGPGSYLVAAPR